MYLMRTNGDALDDDLLASVDGQLCASVSASLCGDLPDHSWWQTITGVTCGGLGLRTALVVALPAFVASRIMCRPLVSTLVDHFSAVPLGSRSWLNTTRALTKPSRALSQPPTNAAQLLVAQLDEAFAERELLWRSVLSGTEDAMENLPSPSLRHARGITPDDGDRDDEHPLARKRLKIQALVTTCVDTGVHQGSRAAPDA